MSSRRLVSVLLLARLCSRVLAQLCETLNEHSIESSDRNRVHDRSAIVQSAFSGISQSLSVTSQLFC
ncbi:hypothetical protein [Thermocoleostomius sinensis]|uniref:Secreted protein n=1 Tax=Thermocoleostomius sinensis A174 TaxID=2016057 RepID=A0A9E8ZEX7_9CYAN|nr:hypothetical protein [Thermocoleostomius sinensis]WAL60584.1 hypothetical protein OXH18_00895 [Thermocoleostomius sinensis A174]